MRPHNFTIFIYLCLLGRSGFVWAVPTPIPRDGTQGISLAKRTFPPLTSGFAHVTSTKIKEVCDAVHAHALPMVQSKLKPAHGNKMPDERAMTESLIYIFREIGGIVVGEHGQQVEGITGTDLYIKVEFEEEEELDVTKQLADSHISPSQGHEHQPAEATPEGHTAPSKVGGSQHPGKKSQQVAVGATSKHEPAASTHETVSDHGAISKSVKTKKHIFVIQAKSSKPRKQADEDSKTPDEEKPKQVPTEPKRVQPSREGAAVTDTQLRERLDAKYPEDPDWEIDFTYKGGSSEDLQMELLQKYVKHLKEEEKKKKENVEVVVIGGYLIYEKDGYIWIPVDDVIAKCTEIAGMEPKDEAHRPMKCRPSRPLNRRLTKYFLGEENTLRTAAHKEHEANQPQHEASQSDHETDHESEHEEGHPARSKSQPTARSKGKAAVHSKATESNGFTPPLRCFLEEMRSQAMRG
ncbi:hypothetical protein FRC14_006614 [Serendipita sp. 396]|nr:hypothetical protein FRC14_006614 [Serendipita sp. 396]KAG8769391.1 hypothetical protein FRC15_004613 [Serendipita sp. 397]KAG8797229.1 hypothetical protein FRC16_009120 [Serendipita sp. 398]KAG8863250.1 hypothetical protein FRC20_010813 [Serendipita sp. 405]